MPLTRRPVSPPSQVVVKVEQPAGEPITGWNRIAKVSPRKRVEQACEGVFAANQRDLDSVIRSLSWPDVADGVVGIHAAAASDNASAESGDPNTSTTTGSGENVR
jgi:hypothetical protein